MRRLALRLIDERHPRPADRHRGRQSRLMGDGTDRVGLDPQIEKINGKIITGMVLLSPSGGRFRSACTGKVSACGQNLSR